MKTLDQDPHQVPPNPTKGTPSRRPKVKDLVLWSAIIALLLVLFAPVILKPRHTRDRYRDTALNNLRQIGLALSDFDEKYGRFPDASTIAVVKESTGTALTLDDTSSNKLFRQLIANGLNSEKLFWAPGQNSPGKPDDVFHLDTKALMPGECGFAYVAGLSSKDDPATPVAMSPLLKGQKIFDRAPHMERAMVLFLDGSVLVLRIEKDGRVMLKGMDLFDPSQPFWKGKAPDIKWQE